MTSSPTQTASVSFDRTRVTATTMHAIVQDEYGSPDALHLREIDTPSIGDNDVLVRVRAASVHFGDVHLMIGTPYLLAAQGRATEAELAKWCQWLFDFRLICEFGEDLPVKLDRR
jgi:hypothetical protein